MEPELAVSPSALKRPDLVRKIAFGLDTCFFPTFFPSSTFVFGGFVVVDSLSCWLNVGSSQKSLSELKPVVGGSLLCTLCNRLIQIKRHMCSLSTIFVIYYIPSTISAHVLHHWNILIRNIYAKIDCMWTWITASAHMYYYTIFTHVFIYNICVTFYTHVLKYIHYTIPAHVLNRKHECS